MPVLLPTPEELAGAPWYARDRAIANAQRLIKAYQGNVVPARPAKRKRMTPDFKKRRDAQRRELVKVEAQRLFDEVGFDPDWQKHQEALMEAVR